MSQFDRAVVLLFVFLILVLSGCSKASHDSYQPLPVPVGITDFELYNQDGQTVTVKNLEQQWSLVFFGFTYCPDVCPTTLADLNKVAAGLGEDSPQIVLVSVDPERDTPKQLKNYIEYFNPAFQAWSGRPSQISDLARQLHIYFDRQPLGDSYTMDHSAQVVLMNPQGEYAGFFPPPLKAAEMTAALKDLM